MKQGGQSRKHELAVMALLTERSIDSAATRAGVSPRTLKNWLHDDGFQKLLQDAKRQLVQGTTSELRRAMLGAAKKMVAIMKNRKTPVGVQLSAATKILEIGFDAHWMEDIEARLRELEQQQRQEDQ